jgi:hypothetical protein
MPLPRSCDLGGLYLALELRCPREIFGLLAVVVGNHGQRRPDLYLAGIHLAHNLEERAHAAVVTLLVESICNH